MLGDILAVIGAMAALRSVRALGLASVLWGQALLAQSALVGWGISAFDTRGRQGVVDIATGADVTAVVRSDGRLVINGDNTTGLASVPSPPLGATFVQVDICWGGGVGLASDGSISVWSTLPPAPVLPAGVVYTQVSLGGGHAFLGHVLALRSDGEVEAWGRAFEGQCNVPTMPPGVSVEVVKACGLSSYAILSDGSIVGWGDNSSGQLQIPPLPLGLAYIDIEQGVDHCVALRSDGQVVAWGGNQFGQSSVPALPAGVTYTCVAAGRRHSQASRSDGSLVAWGQNAFGMLDVPVLDPGVSVLEIACGDTFTVARLSDDSIIAWGYNGLHQAYVPTLPGQQPSAPLARFSAVARGHSHSVAVTSSGAVVGWGLNAAGQSDPPSVVQNAGVSSVQAGVYHSGALLASGQLVCWGDNSVGQCSPPALPSSVVYQSFAIGSGHTVAVRSDGQAVAFGSSSFGATVIPPSPSGVIYTQADAGFGVSALLRSDGEIVSWGNTSFGGLAMHQTPPAPPGLRYVDIALSRSYTGAILSDGSFSWWGSVGSGTAGSWVWHSIPVLPHGVFYVEADSGTRNTMLRRSDGQIVLCGYLGVWDEVPPLEPGTSYVEVSSNNDNHAARVGPTSLYVGVERGCSGSRPASRLVPRDTPRIDRTLEVTVFDLPHGVAVMAMAFQQLGSPVPLASLGMTGCTWHVPLDGLALLSGQNHQAKFELPIPDVPALVGVEFFNQALVLDAAAGNGFGAVVSDVARGVVGEP